MFMIIYTLQVQYVCASACVYKQVGQKCFCYVFGGECTHSDVTDRLPSFTTEEKAFQYSKENI